MATVTDTLSSLIKSRNALAGHTSNLSPAAGQYMWVAIDDINNEIDQLTASGLANAPYVPQTNPFKATTEAGKQFVGTLHDIKSIFSEVDVVVKAVMSVLKVVLAL